MYLTYGIVMRADPAERGAMQVHTMQPEWAVAYYIAWHGMALQRKLPMTPDYFLHDLFE